MMAFKPDWYTKTVLFVVMALVLTACPAPVTMPAAEPGSMPEAIAEEPIPEGEFHWRRYAGTSIRVLLNRHPWQEAIEPLLPEFEELTGITVVTEVYPEDQFRAKLTVELASGVANIDAAMMMSANDGLRWMDEGWAIYLDEFLADPVLTNPDYAADDFLEAAWDAGLTTTLAPEAEEQVIGVPITIENTALMYRKDIFEKHGLAVPTTMEELEAVLQTLQEVEPDLTGIVMRGRRAAATSQWAPFLHSFGGNWLHADGTSAINTPEAVQAFDFYGRMLREYGPPGAVGYHWAETTSDFSSGRSAIHSGPNIFYAIYENPESSAVVGNVGYALFPAGPAGSIPIVGVWGLSIPYISANPEAAWYFIQWASSPEIVRRLQIEEAILGGRTSAWSDPEMAEYYPQDLLQNVLESLEIASPLWNPPVIPVAEVRDVVGEVIVASIEGRDVQEAADAAAQRMNEILGR
jgi:multiple sugar transport system substrate-binding protein